MPLVRVSRENGEWPRLLKQWEQECSRFSESLDEFATASIPTMEEVAERTQLSERGIFALENESGFQSVCQLNVAFLPGYDGKVLRVRHLVLAPRYDFDGALPLEEYGEALAETFAGVVAVSQSDMEAQHIKFHLRSPADQQFFSRLRGSLAAGGAFPAVEMRGAWLYLSTEA